jgi:putative spermidine/putrescine transport system permease protein
VTGAPASLRSSAPALLLGILVLGVPMVVSVGYLMHGASGGLAPDGVQSAVWRSTVADPAVWRSVVFTLWYAAAGTACALMLAMATVLLFAGTDRLDRVVRSIALLPLPVSPLAGAIATLLLLGQSGWFARLAAAAGWIAAPAEFPALVLDPRGVGLIASIAWKEMPFLTMVALTLHASRGPTLVETARTHGATRAHAVRRLVLPMLLRGLTPSLVAVFVFVLGSLELALVLAPSSPLALPMLTQERRQSLSVVQQASGYVVALIGVTIATAAAVLHERLRGRTDA